MTTTRREPLLFSTRAYGYMEERLLAIGRAQRGDVERHTFPDGERYLRVATEVEGRDCVLVGGTVDDSSTLELYDLACALQKEGARSLTVVIPFFGYQTMERAVHPGEVVTAKMRARLLSAIPAAGAQNRVVLLDLHAEGITHYFEGSLCPVHVYAKPLVVKIAEELGGKDFVLAATDAGRAKWVESLANDVGVGASFVFKRRLSDAKTEVTAMSANVEGKRVVIYDDMIRTGSSLVEAARAYKAAGARELLAVATHAVFPGDALARIDGTGLFSMIACTDSHPRALELAGTSPRFRIDSVAPVLATAIRLPPR
jgi:ribose-phosphate pyrophosphokinase